MDGTPRLIERFHEHLSSYVRGEDCYGENGLGQTCDFVPKTAIRDFGWDERRIIDAIRAMSMNTPIPDVSVLLDKFLIIFSILTSLIPPRPHEIALFMQYQLHDGKLPLDGNAFPLPWLSAPECQSVIEDFVDKQWRFCPFIFDYPSRAPNVILRERHILPITREEVLYTKPKVKLHKVTIHGACGGTLPVSHHY